MADPNIEVLKKETYLKVIENSVGSRAFNSVFVRFKDSGSVKDVLNDGEFSCAFFVSAVLRLFDAVLKTRATVKSLREELEQSKNWEKVSADDIQQGDVIFWEEVTFEDGSKNTHVGFAIGNREAVSTDYKKKAVARHPIDFAEAQRGIETVLRYKDTAWAS